MGLKALRDNRAVIDFGKLEMYFLGPADYELEQAMPPGTDCMQLDLAPSGHMVLHCSEFTQSGDLQVADRTLALITQAASSRANVRSAT